MFGRNRARKQKLDDGNVLWIQEIFPTIQGEGPLAGTPAIFIRVAGCNLKCWFCDTDFETSTWRPDVPEIINHVHMANDAENITTDLVVITGGEPFRQNIVPLINALNHEGFLVQIETAGSLWIDGAADLFGLDEKNENIIVCSPKTPKVASPLHRLIHSWKYIVSAEEGVDERDGLPFSSTQHQGKISRPARPFNLEDRPIYLQACDVQDHTKNQANLELAARMCMKHGYRLSVQMHKLADLP